MTRRFTFYRLFLVVPVLLVLLVGLSGCMTTSSSSSESQSSSDSSSNSSSGDSSGSSMPAGSAGEPSRTTSRSPGTADSNQPSQSSGQPGNDEQSARAEAEEASTLEGLGVEDAANDATLQEALETFETAESEKLEPLSENDNTAEGKSNGAGTTESSGARTSEEQLEVLNAELDQALAKFDGAILDERTVIQERKNEQAGSKALPAKDQYDEEEVNSGRSEGGSGTQVFSSDQSEAGQSTEDTENSGGIQPGSQRRQGDYEHASAGSAIPPDIPDGSDDDVVARQIREAAMREKDPELREKLWNEYRKYKSGKTR